MIVCYDYDTEGETDYRACDGKHTNHQPYRLTTIQLDCE